MCEVVIWAVDIGSVMKNRFGWCRIHDNSTKSSQDIQDLVSGIASDLEHSKAVALGFECPLFVPITEDPKYLTSARTGEGSSSWSAGAGCGALATGLTESVWVLERIRRISEVSIVPTFRWELFAAGAANLFLWEAFVTGTAKGITHLNDAEIAAMTFRKNIDDITGANAVIAQNPYSLIGAAMLRAGLTQDLNVLFEPCIVIKA